MSEIRERLIGIDTEYHIDALGIIDRVYCLCATDVSGRVYKKWFMDRDSKALKDVKQFYGVDDPIFVCHAFDKAERRALKWLGEDVFEYSFICTYHLARMLKQDFRKAKKEVDDEERIKAERKEKASLEQSLSYAGLCAKYGLTLVDTLHKEAMRQLCIVGQTDGHESEILSYCADDTAFLLPLLRCLFKEYYGLLRGSFCPLRQGYFDAVTQEEAIMRLVRQTEYLTCFGDIADYGIPINPARVEKVRQNAFAYKQKLESEFAGKYPGAFELGKDGLWHSKQSAIQSYLQDVLDTMGVKNYPRTAKGALSTSGEVLKEFFGGTDTFGEDLRKIKKVTEQLKSISNPDKDPFRFVIDGREWYESLYAYGTKTSRCTPKPAHGYIFGWAKMLYCVIDPPPERWLVELDFSSQETFVQCCICRDSVYNDIYNGKDIYLGFAVKMGLIPQSDYDALSLDELKTQYHDVRKRVKSLVLGLSYGMGKLKLSSKLGISEALAERYVTQFKTVIHKSTSYKELLAPRLNHSGAFSLPDGFVCRAAKNRLDNSGTTIGNFPFQSAGGMILRVVVRELYRRIRGEGLPVRLVATIHDALFFEVAEGDTDTIDTVAQVMREYANKTLAAPEGWSIRVGEPEIIRHGQLWTPEHLYDADALELLNYDG